MFDNGPYVLLYSSKSQPGTSPVTVSGTGDLNRFPRLKIYGSSGEWRRGYCEVYRPENNGYNALNFTLTAFNGSGENAWVKMTDFQITIVSDSSWKIAPSACNEFAGNASKAWVNTSIGLSITRVVGVREPRLA